jgi:cytidylate kinase
MSAPPSEPFRFRAGEREELPQALVRLAAPLARLVVAIDGPAGSGKSSTARGLARRLGLVVLDTGAMYRSLTLAALRRGVDPGDGPALADLLAGLRIDLQSTGDEPRVLLDGADVTQAIRSPEVTGAVSRVSLHPEVRREMVRRQRALGAHGGVVLEGRDIGTVVFPDADLKVFLSADARTRARRRQREDAARGVHRDLAELEAEIRARDATDSTRATSPLVRAADAVLLDTSGLDFEEQLDAVLALAVRAVERRDGAAGDGTPTARPAVQLDEVVPSDWAQPGYRPFRGRLYRVPHLLIRVLARWFLGLRIELHPAARLPGSVLVACNHIAGLDPPLMGASVPFESWFVAKLELFRQAWLARLISRFNAIPIRRGTADFATLDRAVELLQAGRNVVMFPEGTRQRPGRLGTARWGFGYVALRAGRPILPVFVRGSRDLRLRGLRQQPLEVWVGAPVALRLPAGADERTLYLAIGERVMERIAGLMLRSAGRRPMPEIDLRPWTARSEEPLRDPLTPA